LLNKLFTKKALLWALWLANIAIIVGFWASYSGALWVEEELPAAVALGRLFGLLATFAALTQFIIMGRQGWLEPVFGMDHIARFHRLNGYATYILVLSHVALLIIGYSQLTGNTLIEQFIQFELRFPYVLLATIAALLLTCVVVASVYIVRRHLKFESWYFVHLLVYLAIALVPLHQLTNGGDLLANDLFALYWIGLYIFTAVAFLYWRWLRVFYRFWKFNFTVETVVAEAPRATSVYIGGRNMQQFRARGGQFVLVRFLTKDMWWQEHPFSLSQLPNGKQLRLTIRQLGDFTNQIPNLKPGTKVMVSGPHGAFTNQSATANKAVYIAGGVGITPIRSMLQELASDQQKHDAILLYANRTRDEIIFFKELEALSKQLAMPLHHVLSDDASYGEHGFIDKEKLSRLVPDIAARDVFLCGPPPMMAAVIAALRELGVPSKNIHYERFSLH
jgi:predicted ferric reductase